MIKKDNICTDKMPSFAKENGSTYIVVGRSITGASDPVAAYKKCVKEFC